MNNIFINSYDKVRKHSFAELVLFGKALLLLPIVKLLLVLLPFTYISRLLNYIAKLHVGSETVENDNNGDNIAWAVNAATSRLPLKIVCFPRAIVAFYLLKKSRIDAQLYYGVAHFPDRGFESHVWVKIGEKGIVGHQTEEQFKIIMVY